MCTRFVAIWFCHLETDWMTRRNPGLKDTFFALAVPHHGRKLITEVSATAKAKGVEVGMIAEDAKLVLPALQLYDATPALAQRLLKKLCALCITYTPIASVDLPAGLILDATGCTHLWGSEENYITSISKRFAAIGYHVSVAIADTIGAAWAICRYGNAKRVIKKHEHFEALMPLPPAALRIDIAATERFQKLGLNAIKSFIGMPRSVLLRRFGKQLLLRLDQALGNEPEFIEPLIQVAPYNERLPCLEPIVTNTGIEMALQQLLEALCKRLEEEGKGIRTAIFKCYRADHKIEQVSISTTHSSVNIKHLFKLFEIKVCTIEPASGIELFVLEATKVEELMQLQETLWTHNSSLQSKELYELLDRLESKLGRKIINRYLPAEHHLPEHALQQTVSLKEAPTTAWCNEKLRPIQILQAPQKVEVMAPVPDYPPMTFRYKGELHIVKRSDGPERIEPEWWRQEGLHRDYYIVEDANGKRYWLFRLGYYDESKPPAWYVHGFFA